MCVHMFVLDSPVHLPQLEPTAQLRLRTVEISENVTVANVTRRVSTTPLHITLHSLCPHVQRDVPFIPA